jgi:hypothetical protein
MELTKRTTIYDQTHLFITLLWLRQYLTDNLLSSFFGLSNFALNRIVKRTLISLDDSLSEICWPTDDEFERLCVKFRHFGHDELANLILVTDGTEIPIRRPKDKEIQKAFYSPKKKQHSVTIIVNVTLDGSILYVSDPQIGPSDQRHWNQLQLRQLFVNKPYDGIIGDAGFTFNPRNNNATEDNVEILGATRKKRPPHGDLSDKEKRQNRILSSMRAVLDNVIGQIKTGKSSLGYFVISPPEDTARLI